MTNTTFSERLSAMHAIVGEVTRSGYPDSVDRFDLSPTPFTDETDLLEFMHRRWMTLFIDELDRKLESSPIDTRECISQVLFELSVRHWALHAVLATHSTHPALRRAQARHWRLLDSVGLAADLRELPQSA